MESSLRRRSSKAVSPRLQSFTGLAGRG